MYGWVTWKIFPKIPQQMKFDIYNTFFSYFTSLAANLMFWIKFLKFNLTFLSVLKRSDILENPVPSRV